MIQDLTEATRKQPAMILSNLWPYPLQEACATRNHLPVSEDGQSPLENFSGVQVQPNLKNHHTFGCPVYMLNCSLQTEAGKIPKLNPREHLGTNLGHSPCHAHN
eukprot:13892424-Ditylum_brightwellii.AAC.1